MNGQLLFLGLLLAGLALAAWAVARDSEDEDDNVEDGQDGEDGEDERDDVVPTGSRTANRLERRARRRKARLARVALSLVGTGALLVPGTSAAFSATSKSTGSSWTVPAYSYTTTANSFGPYLYWKLGDTGGTAADASGNGRTGTYAGTYTRSVTGGTPDTTPNTAVTATTTACISTTSTTAVSSPAVFTAVVWFKTTAGYATGGKLIGFEAPRTGVAVAGAGGTYDRHIYLDGAGKVWFGVYNGGDQTISTSAAYNDGSWHMAAATIGASGMALYVDGVLRGTNANTGAESSTGWWRVGCGNLAGWGADWTGANNPGTSSATALNMPFRGSLDEATVYAGTALSAANISYLYWTR
jgi:hypothetical protein